MSNDERTQHDPDDSGNNPTGPIHAEHELEYRPEPEAEPAHVVEQPVDEKRSRWAAGRESVGRHPVGVAVGAALAGLFIGLLGGVAVNSHPVMSFSVGTAANEVPAPGGPGGTWAPGGEHRGPGGGPEGGPGGPRGGPEGGPGGPRGGHDVHEGPRGERDGGPGGERGPGGHDGPRGDRDGGPGGDRGPGGPGGERGPGGPGGQDAPPPPGQGQGPGSGPRDGGPRGEAPGPGRDQGPRPPADAPQAPQSSQQGQPGGPRADQSQAPLLPAERPGGPNA